MKKFLALVMILLLAGCSTNASSQSDDQTANQVVTDYTYEVVGTDVNIYLAGEYNIETVNYDEVVSVSMTSSEEGSTAYLVNYYGPMEGSLEEIVSSMCEGLDTDYIMLNETSAYFTYEELVDDDYYVGESYFYLTSDNNYVSIIYHYPTVSISIDNTDLYINTIDRDFDYSVNILSNNPFSDLEALNFNAIDVYKKDNVYIAVDEDKYVQITFNGEDKDALLFKSIMETIHH